VRGTYFIFSYISGFLVLDEDGSKCSCELCPVSHLFLWFYGFEMISGVTHWQFPAVCRPELYLIQFNPKASVRHKFFVQLIFCEN